MSNDWGHDKAARVITGILTLTEKIGPAETLLFCSRDVKRVVDRNLSTRVVPTIETLLVLQFVDLHLTKMSRWDNALSWSGKYTITPEQVKKLRAMVRKDI